MSLEITHEHIELYNENGFVLVKNFIDLDIVKRIKEEVLSYHEKFKDADHLDLGINVSWEQLGESQPIKIRQLMGSQNINKDIYDLAYSDKMISTMKKLLRSEVELFHSKLMMKAAKHGSFTPWHSDWGYWRHIFKAPKLMNAFLAIDESTIKNGAIRYVPGSHKAYVEHMNFEEANSFNIGLPGDINAYPDAHVIEMEPGDVTFHDALCIHGSEANHSEDDRIMNTFAYTAIDNIKNGKEKDVYDQRLDYIRTS